MDIYGWIQLALFVGLLLALTKPLGVYLASVLDAGGKTFLDPVAAALRKIFIQTSQHKKRRRAKLATVCRIAVCFQPGKPPFYLRSASAAALSAAQPAGVRAREPRPCLQYGGELYHQYQLAELRR